MEEAELCLHTCSQPLAHCTFGLLVIGYSTCPALKWVQDDLQWGTKAGRAAGGIGHPWVSCPPWLPAILIPVVSSTRQDYGPRLCTSAVSRGRGMGPLIHPQVGPHASPGTEPPFRRKAKLPKQINQSVKKKPWRKNLSTVSAKKLKRGIVPGDEGGNNRHLLHGLCLWAPLSQLPAPPSHVAPREHLWAGGQPRDLHSLLPLAPGQCPSLKPPVGEAGAKSHCLASGPLLPGTPPSQKLSPLSVQWRLEDLSHLPCQWGVCAHPRRTPSQGDCRNWEGDGDRGDWPQANNEPLDSRAPPASLRRKKMFSGKWGMTSSWKERCNAWVHSQLYPLPAV